MVLSDWNLEYAALGVHFAGEEIDQPLCGRKPQRDGFVPVGKHNACHAIGKRAYADPSLPLAVAVPGKGLAVGKRPRVDPNLLVPV